MRLNAYATTKSDKGIHQRPLGGGETWREVNALRSLIRTKGEVFTVYDSAGNILRPRVQST